MRRRLLLLVGLTMFGAPVFAAEAMAKDPCPNGAMGPDGECLSAEEAGAAHAANEHPPTGVSATSTASATSPPTASSEATACGAPGPEDAALSGEARLQREMDIRGGKIDVCPSASATASDTATASSTEASDSASASVSTPPSATPTATATASGTAPASVAAAVGGSLPATDGLTAPLVGIGTLMLLAGAGVISIAIVRRAS